MVIFLSVSLHCIFLSYLNVTGKRGWFIFSFHFFPIFLLLKNSFISFFEILFCLENTFYEWIGNKFLSVFKLPVFKIRLFDSFLCCGGCIARTQIKKYIFFIQIWFGEFNQYKYRFKNLCYAVGIFCKKCLIN